jgi:ABC-2 type transport system ATP-binding protein
MAKVVVENLTKRYGEQTAVDNISFSVNSGEIVGFIGPNGAGKSSTMRMITSFMPPTSGKIFINSVSLDKDPVNTRRHIGYLAENNPLYSDMFITDYLAFCARIQGVERNEVSARIKNMVRICGLNPEKHKRIYELSKGFRQRVGLAQALIHDPDILILDEPTTGLDPNQIVEIRSLIKELGKKKTIILSSHILSEIEAICDRIIIINSGTIVTDRRFDSLKQEINYQEVLIIQIEAPSDDDVETAVLNLPTVEQVKQVHSKPGYFQVKSIPGLSSRKEIFQLCVNRNWFLTEMTGLTSTLEDVFREVTH